MAKQKTPLLTGAQAADALGAFFEQAGAALLGGDITARSKSRQDLRITLGGETKTVEVKSIRDSLSRGWRVVVAKASDYALLWLWHEPSSGRGRTCAEYYGNVEAMLKFASQSVTGAWLLPFPVLAALRDLGPQWRGERNGSAWREVRVSAVRRYCAEAASVGLTLETVEVDWLKVGRLQFRPFRLWNCTDAQVCPPPF